MAKNSDVGTDSQDEGDEKIIANAQSRLALAEEATSEMRRLALEDLEFRVGKHWPDSIKQERDRDGRPCLVINRIPQFIQQVTNDQRQNRPSIKVHPVDEQGDIETAKVIQGLIRHIEYNSNADVAYDTAFDSAATGGFGYFRILTDFVDPTSFDQEILIKRIRNPLSVYLDPHSQEPDGSDANWAILVEDVSAEEYKARYPKSELAGDDVWKSVGSQAPGWMQAETCRVAEYFYKEYETQELVLLNDGQVIEAGDLDRAVAAGLSEVRRRSALIPVVRWCKLNAVEVLEKSDWAGKYIPIIPVYGNELYVNGERILEGIVRNAKDPQRMYNYWKSAETEAIALAPKAPFIAAEGQIEGYAADWDSANRKNHSVLKYKPTSVNGTLVGPPQRQAFEPAVQAITQAAMLAGEDLKATTGIYDAALGARSNETSGVAIQRRNVQAQTSNFHFIDNLTRSLRHAGRVLVDLIPHIYDTERSARIIGDDGEQKVVKLNQKFEENGKQVLYQMDAGKYDVTVDVGPSFASKRQEAAASMMEMTRAVPQLMQVAGDLLFKAMDTPYAAEIAERLKKTLPPGLADDPSKKQEIPPQVQAQMQHMSQMVEQLTGQLNKAHDTMDKKLIEIESHERIEFKRFEVQLEIERAKLDAKDSLALLSAEIAQLGERQQLLRMNQPIDDGEEQQESPQAQPPQQQNFAPQSDGAMSAGPEGGGQPPTGGVPPGTLMEGN